MMYTDIPRDWLEAQGYSREEWQRARDEVLARKRRVACPHLWDGVRAAPAEVFDPFMTGTGRVSAGNLPWRSPCGIAVVRVANRHAWGSGGADSVVVSTADGSAARLRRVNGTWAAIPLGSYDPYEWPAPEALITALMDVLPALLDVARECGLDC